jgi:hypothetical protein
MGGVKVQAIEPAADALKGEKKGGRRRMQGASPDHWCEEDGGAVCGTAACWEKSLATGRFCLSEDPKPDQTMIFEKNLLPN